MVFDLQLALIPIIQNKVQSGESIFLGISYQFCKQQGRNTVSQRDAHAHEDKSFKFLYSSPVLTWS